MVLNAVTQLNLVPAKGGVSEYYSPHIILKRPTLDWNKHCQYKFGAYVQANQDNNPTNTNWPRTIDGIYLRPCWDQQGGHEVLNLETGEVVSRQYVTPIPITSTIIRAVESMAEAQGVKSMRITGRNNVRILPADWIAGVHYDEEIEDEDNDEYENDDEEDDGEHDDDGDINNEPITQDEIDDLLAEDQQPQAQQPEEQEANPTGMEIMKIMANKTKITSKHLKSAINQPINNRIMNQKTIIWNNQMKVPR